MTVYIGIKKGIRAGITKISNVDILLYNLGNNVHTNTKIYEIKYDIKTGTAKN